MNRGTNRNFETPLSTIDPCGVEAFESKGNSVSKYRFVTNINKSCPDAHVRNDEYLNGIITSDSFIKAFNFKTIKKTDWS